MLIYRRVKDEQSICNIRDRSYQKKHYAMGFLLDEESIGLLDIG